MSISDAVTYRIGVFNVVILVLSLFLTSYCRWYAVNKYNKRIFSLLSLYALFELPMYFLFAVEREYTGRVVYIFHIISNLFYFASFSVLCFSWGDVLRAKNMEELFESQVRSRMRAIIVVGNIIFTCHSTVVVYFCASSSSLQEFFELKSYIAYTISDTCKNFVMGIFIFRFGGKLYARVKNYSAFYETRIRDPAEMAETTRHLLTASDKLKILVLVINFCFSVRVVALIIWLGGNAPTENEEPSNFPHFDFLYWSLFQTLPSVLPSFTLCFTMGCLAKIFGGVFIDTNKKHTTDGGASSAQNRKIYNSDSSDDDSADLNNPNPNNTLKSLSIPFLGSMLSLGEENEDSRGEANLFNRLSRVSGELVDIDIERNSGEKGKGQESTEHSVSTSASNSSAIMTPPVKSHEEAKGKRLFGGAGIFQNF
jgi:hypothetical protein